MSKNTFKGKDGLPVRLLNDRILVHIDSTDGERKSSGGIVIPATAQVAKRLIWARVVATGPNVRNVNVNDRVMFEPDERYEVELQGQDYILLRERDIHAVATNDS
ncbi:MAG: GroES family chaperonin, partial [Candidatus Nanopelagicales bacterium]